ncbi:MAG TPA: sialidase family protein [Baekduia sp.]|nr:sialidase family protein [Baekduia sp.]
MSLPCRVRAALTAATLLVLLIATAAQADTRVSVGAPPGTPFSQNKQNEPALAVDANHPNILVAGSNDEIDMEGCAAVDEDEDPPGSQCPFTPGVGVSGVYFSFDRGHTWTQPTYTGASARACVTPTPCVVDPSGPIGTLPWYGENGLVSDGDPAVAFGPVRGADGTFSWANGSRLYYANLTSSAAGAIKGFEAIAVSRTDDVAAAAAGSKAAWKAPVIVSKQSSTLFADKEQIWADNVSTSPYFGNAYICYAAYRSQEKGGGLPEPIIVSRSTDGGSTWTTKQVSSAALNRNNPGRDGCTVRTDSQGTVYVFYRADDPKTKIPSELMTRSFDGGRTFEPARAVARPAETAGLLDPTILRPVMDGIAGARADLAPAPSVDIANGAPNGAGATDQIAMAWVDGSLGINNERALLSSSLDGGVNWSTPAAVPVPGRPYYVAPGIAPDGSRLYLSYNAFTTTYQPTTATPRVLVGGLLGTGLSATGAATGWAAVDAGAPGDPRGSSQNNLMAEFLGDYVYAIGTRTYGAGVYNDARNAADCPAVDAFRQAYENGVIAGDLPPIAQEDSPAERDEEEEATAEPTAEPPERPSIPSQCSPDFGNSDIYGATSAP